MKKYNKIIKQLKIIIKNENLKDFHHLYHFVYNNAKLLKQIITKINKEHDIPASTFIAICEECFK